MREEQAKAASLGREELERKLKNWNSPIAIDDAVAVLCRYYKLKTGTELYGQIADGKINIGDVKELISRHLAGEPLHRNAPPPPAGVKAAASPPVTDALVIDDTIKNLEYKFAKCCNPIFGTTIFRLRDHKRRHHHTPHYDCPNAVRLIEQYPYRVIPASGATRRPREHSQAAIRVTAENYHGHRHRITEVVTSSLRSTSAL